MTEKNSFETVRPVRQSFMQIFESVVEYTEAKNITLHRSGNADPQAIELCKIITEVLMFDPDEKIIIAKERMQASTVQDVFRQLRSEHLELVLFSFSNGIHYIANKRAYLRTALYNAFFEHEFYYSNLVKSDMAKELPK